MKALRILLVVAVSMLMVGSAFGQAEFSMGGRADYSVQFESSEVGDADAVTTLDIDDGGRVQLKGKVSKDLDNGATASLEGVLNLEREAAKSDKAQIKYANGPLTVTMIKANRPGVFKKGMDLYIPKAAGDPGRYQAEDVSERGVCFEYAGEGMSFATTVNIHGDNRLGVRPYVELGAGPATIRAAVEYITEFPLDTDADGPKPSVFGAGASVVSSMGAIELSASAAYSMAGGKDDAGKDVDETSKMSVYGYATMGVGAGKIGVMGGMNLESVDKVDDDATGIQAHVSYEQKDVIIPGLKLTATVGYATAEDHSKVESNLTGGKVRLRYEF